MNKTLVLEAIREELQERLEIANQSLRDLIESRDSEEKSSSGDKYETGREMAQQEMERADLQIQQIKGQLAELKLVPVSAKPLVGLGSLVITNVGAYYISISFGKIIVENTPVFAISKVSPIGNLFMDKKVGDKVKFGAVEHTVLEVL